ncbi:Leucine-rich repeat protein kinase family protein [Rhynchospora pubera]|uniref:Leucine-rich repeat protein kinase family protein n=1 Tax=Rhynchospora pubera TaxID=906938 RepID=A0AAV8ETU2_9POAL|nr:Leucine-rich repeat protein kinase family protein [Rhynchospora pubera]
MDHTGYDASFYLFELIRTLPGMNIKGKLNDSIGLLTELTYLDLSSNMDLGGPLPASIGELKKLTNLALNSNNFIGSIPSSIGLLLNLDWLDLADNQLTGPLPISSATTPGLDNLTNTSICSHFNKNNLSGTISASLFSTKMSLIHMIFDSNSFSGPIPDTIGFAQKLQTLQLDNNKLSGNIPININSLSGLCVLNLANNQLSGRIPSLSQLTNLSLLNLSNNSFTPSTAPSWFSTLTSLNSLAMENTQLTGQIPGGLFALDQIKQVLLDSNQFNGTLDISSNLGQNLQNVSIRNNNITEANITSSYNGSISLVNNPLCQSAKYSNNLYCQSQQKHLPPYSTSLANCKSASCTGTQKLNPRSCTCAYPFSGLMVFRAATFNDISDSNKFQEIESSLWEQLKLASNSVYISDVAITLNKYIEANVALFPLSGINFSTSDAIRLLTILDNQIYEAPEIFRPYYFIKRQDQLPGSGSSSSISKAAVAGIAVGGCIILIAIALLTVYGLKQRRKVREAAAIASPFGYLTDGVAVAIKRAAQGSMQGAQEFKYEIELLSRVHHKNLVGLVGFCYEHGEQLLVYEYISNGTLRENLLGKDGMYLDWRKRLQIALGAARGLAYLHELANPPIIHRDIKSTVRNVSYLTLGNFRLSRVMCVESVSRHLASALCIILLLPLVRCAFSLRHSSLPTLVKFEVHFHKL